jgi:hypothetical protein
LAVIAPLLAGCGFPSGGSPTPAPPGGTPTPATGISPIPTPTAGIYASPLATPATSSNGDRGWLDWDGAGGWASAESEGVVRERSASAPLAAAPTAAAASGSGSNAAQSSLKAGEVDDNAQWDDYLLYRQQYAGPPAHERDVSERYVVSVTDAEARPLLDAGVTFYSGDWAVFSARTYASGQVLFFPKALGEPKDVESWRVVVEKDDARQEATLRRDEDYRLAVTLRHSGRPIGERINLDVLFLIDSTGSMSDEIARLQDSIQQIAARIDRLPGQPEVRFAMTIYRDRGDLFVTRTFDFTPDVKRFSQALAEVRADGGGDTPESVNEALYRAIHAPEWRSGDTVKLVFLVADAPPHLDYAQDYDYAVEMQEAAQRGIKVFCVASSGLDDQGEYIFRQIAQFTQGRFIFLTYAPGGGPGDTTTHHVEDYSVQNLDDLVVRLVEEELAYQFPIPRASAHSVDRGCCLRSLS